MKGNLIKTKILIISAFPGCGKTFFTIKNKSNLKILDLDFYFYHIKNNIKQYFIDLISAIGIYDIIFVTTHEKIRKFLKKNKLIFYCVFPNKKRKNEFISLYSMRGNCKSFIKDLTINFDNYIDSFQSENKKYQIQLNNENEFISNNKKIKELIKKLII